MYEDIRPINELEVDGAASWSSIILCHKATAVFLFLIHRLVAFLQILQAKTQCKFTINLLHWESTTQIFTEQSHIG
jgi:hypothetical protein